MKLVAITSCPTGIAHSQMAAENLEQTAEKLGHEIRVEIQGAMGAEDELSSQEIAEAGAVIIAADTSVNRDRFEGVVVKGTVKEAVNDAESLINQAVEEAGGSAEAAETPPSGDSNTDTEGQEGERRGGDPEKGLFRRLKRMFS